MRRAGARAAACAALAVGLTVATGAARGARPSFTGEGAIATYGQPDGHVLVHYVQSGVDAVPAADADTDQVPDFVEEVASVAEASWADLVARGFRTPLVDSELLPPGADDGGDARFDIYLTDLTGADGHFEVEACTTTPFTCAGFFSMDNDVAGFGYPSVAIGVRVLVSHELFHAVQQAYDGDQPASWSEGTAVWNEEQTFPEQDDFEGFLGAFLGKPQRPFERPGGGFGDLYAYGAAVWPTYLEERFGPGSVRAVWEHCVQSAGAAPDFLDAAEVWLDETQHLTLAQAWTEFTRWNLFTGTRADATRSYAHAAGWPEVPLAFTVSGAVGASAATSVEGFSAVYGSVDLSGSAGAARLLRVQPKRPIAAGELVAAAVPAGGGDPVTFTDGEDGGVTLAIPADDARTVDLVITGLARGTTARALTVSLELDPTPPVPADDGGCGCRVGAAREPSGPPGALLFSLLGAVALGARRARRRPRGAHAALPHASSATRR